VVVARRDGARKLVAFGFALEGTDLTLRVAFPLLLVNALDWFAGDSAEMLTTYVTGQPQRVALDGATNLREVVVRDPDGVSAPAPVVDGVATFYAGRVGFYRIELAGAGAPARELAANLASPSESRIAPSPALTLGGQPLQRPASFAVTRSRTLWAYLVLAALLLLVIEWVTYHRRITV
jgi:hypothetical protein